MKAGSSIHCVLFDMGRVLVKVNYQSLAARMVRMTGLTPENLREVFTAGDLVRKFECGRIDEGEFYAEVCRRSHSDIPWDDFLEAWVSIIEKTPQISESVLSSLSQSADLWIISNTNRLHFDYISKTFAFMRLFSGCVLSYEVGVLKPDEGIFRYALDKAGVGPQEALFVDDQQDNVEAARRLGIDAFQFQDPDQFVSELRSRALLR